MSIIKKFCRFRMDRIVYDVCDGIEVYIGVDPNIIRPLWVVLTILNSFIESVLYSLACLIIPEELVDKHGIESTQPRLRSKFTTQSDAREKILTILGIALVIIGISILYQRYLDIWISYLSKYLSFRVGC